MKNKNNSCNFFLVKIFISKRALFFYLALFIFNSNLFSSSILSEIESKCLWIEKYDMVDSSKIDSIINFSISNNINKLFVEVRSRGDALYDSKLVPKYEKLDVTFDPLEYFINKVDSIDIEIHAWFNTYLLWSDNYLPINKNHYYYQCNNCFEADFNGKSDKDINLSENQSKNWEGLFISPIHPEVNEYLFNIVNDLFKNYSIDGLNLDYLRYQDIFFGYNEIGIDNFIDIYDVDPRDINRGIISTRYGFSEELIDSLKDNWDLYRINKISELVRSIKYKILNDSLNISLSALVKPNYFEAKNRWYQDWMSWINEDIVDFVIIKNYDMNLSNFNYNNKLISKNVSNFIKENKIFIGFSCNDENFNSISNKIFLSRLQGYKNYGFLNYSFDQDTLNWEKPIFRIINSEY